MLSDGVIEDAIEKQNQRLDAPTGSGAGNGARYSVRLRRSVGFRHRQADQAAAAAVVADGGLTGLGRRLAQPPSILLQALRPRIGAGRVGLLAPGFG